jgi:hypothetical protein
MFAQPPARSTILRTDVRSVMVAVGLILVGMGVALVLADWGDLSKRMPTQVAPRSIAAVPLAVGVCLVAADLLW